MRNKILLFCSIFLLLSAFGCTRVEEMVARISEKREITEDLSLGYIVESGEEDPLDYQAVAKWNLAEAEKGSSEAQYHLATMYYEGKGLPRDYQLALKWHSQAADQGHAEAQYHLGRMHYYGKGVAKNISESYAWINLSAAQGNENAIRGRDQLEKHMSIFQIQTGQERSRELYAGNGAVEDEMAQEEEIESEEALF